MATDLIRYDLLVQNAFRDIFRKVLADVAAKGLPGDHHFLVTFRTGAPGVKISDRLRQAHPQDMTIVLQHQFWDLAVTDTGFSVGLSFKNVPEKLVVPFSAVTGFFDPSVNFGAEFTVEPVAAPPEPKPVSERPLSLATEQGPRGARQRLRTRRDDGEGRGRAETGRAKRAAADHAARAQARGVGRARQNPAGQGSGAGDPGRVRGAESRLDRRLPQEDLIRGRGRQPPPRPQAFRPARGGRGRRRRPHEAWRPESGPQARRRAARRRVAQARGAQDRGAARRIPRQAMTGAPDPSPDDTKLAKHSLIVAGHRTSVSLEGAFWRALREEATRRRMSIAALVSEIDGARKGANLSSALRVHVLCAALAAGTKGPDQG